jgi:ribosomal RNA-processing protein 7
MIDKKKKKVKMSLQKMHGYCVLPVSIGIGAELEEEDRHSNRGTPFVRYIYFKRHESKRQRKRRKHSNSNASSSSSDDDGDDDDDEIKQSSIAHLPSERTLFVANPAFDCSDEDIRALFSSAGTVERVELGALGDELLTDVPSFLRSGAVHVVFESAESAERALVWRRKDAQNACRSLGRAAERGLSGWIQRHQSRRTPRRVLLHRSNTFMKAYDERLLRERDERDATGDKADDDGWVVVRRRGKKAGRDATNTAGIRMAYSVASQDEVRHRSEKQVLDDFYTFQQRAGRIEQLAELRQQFEIDKQRIAKMKGDRRFKPF